MRTRYRPRIGSTWMDSLDKNLAVLDVSYSGLERNLKRQSVADLDGFEIIGTEIVRQTVTISFELHIYDVTERNNVCQAVNKWASASNMLRTNDREGQYLNVACEQFATLNARDWTAPLSLVFTSINIPYWQSYNAITKTISGKNVSSTMALDGNVGEALVTATVTSTKGVLKTLKLVTGATTIELTGLSIPKDEQVYIDYVSNRYLRIRHLTADGQKSKGSLLPKLKATSSDNLKIPSGKSSSVSVTADNNVKVALSAKGLWL